MLSFTNAFRTYHIWKYFDYHCYQNVFEGMDLNQNMMVYLQGKLRALANVITERRIVIFMKKKKKLFSYIDLKGNFLT